ncbi:MAG TPA: Fic family protein [Crocinitomicaceae bacterium]|nr:Fic family protein [Crocinitomicaceae bacterium]
MLFDATYKSDEPITEQRLFGWHNALFPTGMSGLCKIKTATWRDDSTGPMQVVSGAMGKEKIHFQAPDATLVPAQMHQFLDWFNTKNIDDVLKAAVAHLWFVTIHPFEDGNGRIARTLTELLLTRSDKSKLRFYSMSAQIRLERKAYYDILEKTEQGGMDITLWINWFLNCLKNAITTSEETLTRVLQKADFWKKHAETPLNERQVKMLNKLLDGFDGKLQTSKWAKITKTSTDTALRDIKDLIQKEVLQPTNEGGRNVNYELKRD